jgi:peptidoglycan/LPS O-acetylase OafA/YrhL
MLLNLHLLRAVAALSVVYFHTTSEAGLNLPVNVGAHGVDVFFVISGFIVTYVSVRSPDRFLVRRVIRIVPFYWTATIALFILAALAPHALRSTQPDVKQLVCSLFFVPRETSYAGVVPTLVLGWSLNYEMYFYLMFAVALVVAPRRAPLACCFGIVGTALGIALSEATHPSIRFYARPIVFEFVFGICVYFLFEAAVRRIGWFTRRAWVRWGLGFAALGSILFIGLEETHGGFGLPRFLVAGLPASSLVLAAAILERIYEIRTGSNIVFTIGESSYILYLIHPYVIYGLLRTTITNRGALSWPATTALVIALLVLSTVTATAIHMWLEKPVLVALRRRLLRVDRRDAWRAGSRLAANALEKRTMASS